jgi:hypothetical protein
LLGSTPAIVSGAGGFAISLPSAACRELTDPSAPATISGEIRWDDAAGHEIGTSAIDPQPLDLRGGTVVVRAGSAVFPGHTLSLRIAPDAAGCGAGAPSTIARFATGRVTAWPE